MPKDYSPFTPGLPVPVEFFVGRLQEVTRLKDKAAAAAGGKLQVGFLSGERRIGKSSLADNFLTRMKRLEVVRSDPDGGPGAYRFGNHLHYLYFWLEAERAKKTREP